jgi:hypothetical protein
MHELPVMFPPPVTDDAANGERGKGKIYNTRIKSLSGPLSHLLGGTRADRALGIAVHRTQAEKKDEAQ